MPHKDRETFLAYHKAYRQAKREQCQASAAAWREAHREELRAKARARYQAIKEQAKAYAIVQYWEHRDEVLAYKHATRATSAARARQRLATDPTKARAKGHRRRTRKYALPHTFTFAEEAFCRAYFHQSCAVCGNQEGFQWTISMDHFIPLASPDCPGTVATNMIPLCHGIGGCNNSKHKKDPEQWLRERFGPRKAAQILKKIRAYFALVIQSRT